MNKFLNFFFSIIPSPDRLLRNSTLAFVLIGTSLNAEELKTAETAAKQPETSIKSASDSAAKTPVKAKELIELTKALGEAFEEHNSRYDNMLRKVAKANEFISLPEDRVMAKMLVQGLNLAELEVGLQKTEECLARAEKQFKNYYLNLKSENSAFRKDFFDLREIFENDANFIDKARSTRFTWDGYKTWREEHFKLKKIYESFVWEVERLLKNPQ